MCGLDRQTLQDSTHVVCFCGFGADIFVSLSTQATSGVQLASNPVETGVLAPGVKRPGRGHD